jgi:hypothetical protein
MLTGRQEEYFMFIQFCLSIELDDNLTENDCMQYNEVSRRYPVKNLQQVSISSDKHILFDDLFCVLSNRRTYKKFTRHVRLDIDRSTRNNMHARERQENKPIHIK